MNKIFKSVTVAILAGALVFGVANFSIAGKGNGGGKGHNCSEVGGGRGHTSHGNGNGYGHNNDISIDPPGENPGNNNGGNNNGSATSGGVSTESPSVGFMIWEYYCGQDVFINGKQQKNILCDN